MTDTIKPVAWLHTVRTKDRAELDAALSFAPDNFPLQGLFESIDAAPLVAFADVAALVRQMRDALAGIDEAYCRAGSPLTRDERTEDRKRLMAARQSAAAADAFLAQHNAPNAS